MATIYKRGETYWGRVTRDGREHRQSLKTEDRALAKQRLTAWVAKLESVNFGERQSRTFDEAAVKFIDEHLPTIKPKSAQRYGVSIANLTKTFEGMELTKIGKASLTEFTTMRRHEGVKAPTIRRDLACLSSIFGMAIEWEWIDVSPVGPFLKRMRRRGLRESPPRTRYLSHDEETALLEHAAPYVADAVRFAIDTGLRKEEQFSRTWANIDLAKNEVTVKGSNAKNARDRSVPLWPRVRAVVETMPRHRTLPAVFWHHDLKGARSPRRFNTMDRGLKAAAKRAGIKDLRWHDLRRTCGCRLLQDKGFSIEAVSKWLGHSSIEVTQRAYAFLESEQLHREVGRVAAQKSAH